MLSLVDPANARASADPIEIGDMRTLLDSDETRSEKSLNAKDERLGDNEGIFKLVLLTIDNEGALLC
jgi:hypothetical protein